ncbi:MAG: SH3 domain-containing protein [Chloroflexota bacterium]|nr:SH3 domain-containing protein [Chloroflexota bacterium]
MPARTTSAAESVALPFPGGKAVRIIQGYSGGTHRGRSQYGLDLVLADGGTSGAEVVSPIEGTVTYSQAPKVGNGCMAIAYRDGSHSVMLCHVIFHRTFSRGESIARGQSLGTVGPAGTVGNNGTPHVHLELHRGSRASSPVPFSRPEGLALEGLELAATGTFSEHGRREPIMSTNRAGGGTVASSTTRSDAVTQPLAARSEPVTLTAASLSSQGRSIDASAAAATTSTRAAVVHGTESCLKVRQQPSADAPVVECLPEGAEVKLKPLASGAESRWRQVDGGWVAGEYLKRTSAVVAGTDACLNVRESPKTGATLHGCLPEGTTVKIVEGPTAADGFDWYRIERAGSLEKGGWVVGRYLD